MIKLVQKEDIPLISAFLNDSPVSMRISTLLSVYKTDFDFIKFYIQLDESGKITAVLSDIDGACTVQTEKNANFEELRSFSDFSAFTSLTAEKDLFFHLGTVPDRTGDILKFSGEGKKSLYVNGDPDLKGVFSLLKENEGKSIERLSFLPWLSDFTFRRNRQRARVRCIEKNGETVCAAVTSAETEKSALISGMVTKKEYRGMGLGRELLLHIGYEIKKEEKTLYVMTAERELNGFYEKSGFEIRGQWGIKEV